MTINQEKLWAGFRWAGDRDSFSLVVEGESLGIHGLIPPRPMSEWATELGRASHLAHGVEAMARERKFTKGELLLMNLLMLVHALNETTGTSNLRQPLLGLLDAVSWLFEHQVPFQCACEKPSKAAVSGQPQVEVKFVQVNGPEELEQLLAKLYQARRGGAPFTPPSGTLN